MLLARRFPQPDVRSSVGQGMRSPKCTLAVLILAACGGAPSGPAPTPSPSPTPLMGKANATVLANVDVVRQVERATGRHTILVWVGTAGAGQSGTPLVDSSWHYTFAGSTTDGVVYHDWAVRETGVIEPRDVFPVPGLVISEIGPSLRIDSDEAARLARSYGGQPISTGSRRLLADGWTLRREPAVTSAGNTCPSRPASPGGWG